MKPNISEVIGWKFSDQEGMSCKEVKGILTIVEFPGGIPTQADQDTWTTEYNDWVSAGGLVDKEELEFNFSGVMLTIAKAFHNINNRVRALEGKAPWTLKQTIKALRSL